MLTQSFPLFKILGFTIRLDLSWFFIAFLLVWSLSTAHFPNQLEDQTAGVYWTLGVLGTLGLFASVVLHELGHATVARKFDLPMRGITLFIFGGVAEMEKEPESAKAEFWIAIGGPLVSLALAGVFWAMVQLPLPGTIHPLITYLAFINTALLVFNLIPAFPLDGGRILRAILWGFGKNLRRSTRISSAIGGGFGWLLIGLGMLQLLSGFLLNALWWVLIGLFLKNAAGSAYQQVVIRRLLEGHQVKEFMRDEPVSIPADTTLSDAVENYIYRYHHKAYPVLKEDQLTGLFTTRQVKDVERDQWDRVTVGELAQSVTGENSIAPDDDIMKAMAKMRSRQSSRLLVTENGSLQGILSLKDLLDFIGLKIELEEDAPAPPPEKAAQLAPGPSSSKG